LNRLRVNAINTAPQKPGIKSLILTEFAAAFEGKRQDSQIALWDTGATLTTICSSLAEKLSLQPISVAVLSTANGQRNSNVYVIDLELPNRVVISNLTVCESDFSQSLPRFHALIGMDVINRGDFSITNFNGNTVMNFRMPSIEEHDWVQLANRNNAILDKIESKAGFKSKK